MAIKSPLNPGVIARERRVTPEAVQNFISGGSPLGSSVVASAANKIVGFQRGTAGVAPQVPDLGSIINTLSSNILNNVENRVQAITQNVNQIVQKTVGDLQNRFISKTDSIDANAPNKILSNFLSLYDKAIGYIRFFANPNNIKSLNESLVELRKVFDETFKVAKSIRQTIIRIVDQLSNLPTANAGGGGIDLDVKVPGPPLKRAGNTGILRSMRRRPGLMLGGAALAGAGTGAMVTNALQDVGGGVQPQLMGETGEGLSGPLLDKFNAILDRFSAVLKSLSTRPSKQQPGGGKSTSTQAKDGARGATGAPGAPGVSGSPGVTTTGEKGVLDLIASVEQGPEGYDSFNTSAGKTPGKATEQTIGWLAKNARGAIGRYQQMPQYLLERAQRAGFNANTKFTPEVQDAITLNELRSSHGINEFLSGKISEEQFLQKLAPTWRGLPQGKINAAKLGGTADLTYQDQYSGRNLAGKTYATTISELRNIRSGGNKPVASTQQRNKPAVVAAPAQQQMQQQSAQQVAQVPATQSQPQVNILPLQGGAGNQQGTAKPPQAPITGIRGETVPMLPTTNPDNFLTLYSKMVYNIVDG